MLLKVCVSFFRGIYLTIFLKFSVQLQIKFWKKINQNNEKKFIGNIYSVFSVSVDMREIWQRVQQKNVKKNDA